MVCGLVRPWLTKHITIALAMVKPWFLTISPWPPSALPVGPQLPEVLGVGKHPLRPHEAIPRHLYQPHVSEHLQESHQLPLAVKMQLFRHDLGILFRLDTQLVTIGSR